MKQFLDNILVTVVIFLAIWLISLIPVNISLLNPIENTLKDFDLTDIVFSHFRADVEADTNIVIVNIGNLDRAGLAEQVRLINKQKPKVIGIDSFFRKLKDPEGDSILAQAFSEVENLVLVSGINHYNEKKKQFDTLETSHPLFLQNAKAGFANLISRGATKNILTNMEAEEFVTCRTFSPQEKVNGKVIYSFGVEIAKLYQPKVVESFLKRKRDWEYINYRGNYNKFKCLDVNDLFEENVEADFMKDKIVLLGYMGPDLNTKSLEDKFYTPLNKNYIGKTHPDMFGIVVHANIISMILHGNYINEMPEVYNILFSVIICFLAVWLFSIIYKKMGLWYDGISIVMQLIISLGILYIILVIFEDYHIKMELNLALIAVVLSSNILEIYYAILKKIFRIKRR